MATDNTAVTVWPQSDRVFTSTETNRIIEVDPDTLKTKDTVKNCEWLNFRWIPVFVEGPF